MAFQPPKPELDKTRESLMSKNAVYYPSWRVYRGDTPASLNYDYITTVYYAFAHVAPDGGVYVSLYLPHMSNIEVDQNNS